MIKKASDLGNLPDLVRSFKFENSLKKTNAWLADNVAELGRFNSVSLEEIYSSC